MVLKSFHRFKQFGGWRLLWAYTKEGLLLHLLWYFIKGFVHRRGLDSIYSQMERKVIPILKKKYGGIILESKHKNVAPLPPEGELERRGDNNDCYVKENRVGVLDASEKGVVWFCWFQGVEVAPALVKRCLESVERYLPEKRIVTVDHRNYRDYVDFPSFIEEKFQKGDIPHAMFTDILRLELLIRHGGMWLDSSVLMTDPDKLEKREWLDGLLDADLFMFQYMHKQTKRFQGISSWVITANAGNWALMTLRDMLYAYWRDYDCVLDYYIFHRFFGMIVEQWPEVLNGMPRRWSIPSLYLRDCLADDYDEEWWKELTSHVCFHKLNYRKAEDAARNSSSYYNHFMFDHESY